VPDRLALATGSIQRCSVPLTTISTRREPYSPGGVAGTINPARLSPPGRAQPKEGRPGFGRRYMASIAGQHVVVLGGTSGFGFATAKAAIAEGPRVTVASRSTERVRSALEPLGRCWSGFLPASGRSIIWR
jgi:hypothetical protein